MQPDSPQPPIVNIQINTVPGAVPQPAPIISLDEAAVVGQALPAARSTQTAAVLPADLDSSQAANSDHSGTQHDDSSSSASPPESDDTSSTQTSDDSSNETSTDTANDTDNQEVQSSNDTKGSLKAAVLPVTAAGEKARQLATELQAEAARAEAELSKTEQQIQQAEKDIKHKSHGASTTVAGYPVAELAKVFFRPPKPAEQSSDPETQQAKQEIEDAKQQAKEAKKQVTALKQQAEKFQKQELPPLQKLNDIAGKTDN